MAAKADEAEAFFTQALVEAKDAPPLEKAGFMPLPERYRRALFDHVAKNFGSSLIFRSLAESKQGDAHGQYTDRTFPPDRTSLIKFWDLADLQAQVEWKDFTWERVSTVHPHFAVFHNIEPGDIRQGLLGDCYFLSALSSLAERPDRIKRLFVTTEPSLHGQYKVQMMDMGQWREYVVDDYFPMKDSDFAFSSPYMEEDICELWVLLLEKVWAKKYGSYYDIQTGFADEVLTDLTGAPCRILQRTEPRLWEYLAEADGKNHIITAGCVGRAEDPHNAETLEGLGLVIDHSYAVIAVKEVKTNAGIVRLLQVRNPWRRFEWSGDWSDYSPKWTTELKRAVNFSNEQDGAFWMSLEDFLKYFETCTICMAEDSYWTISLPMDQTKEEQFSVVQMDVRELTDLYVIACQVDERRFGGPEGGYAYSPVRMLAARQTSPNTLHYLTGNLTAGTRDAWVYLPGLTPGIYLIYIEFQWKSEATDLFGVSVYSSQDLTLTDVTADNTNYLEKCFNPATLPALLPKEVADNAEYKYSTLNLSASNGSQPNIYCDWLENKTQARAEFTLKHDPWVNMDFAGMTASESGTMQVSLAARESRVVVKKQKRMEGKHSFKAQVTKTAS